MNNLVVHEHNVSDIERMARAFAASKLFGISTPDQALALCLIAQAEGRHPASAAQDYHIIQGRPSKKADAMLRDFLAGGGKVEWHALDDDIADATFSHPAGGSVRITWDMARAKKAELKTAMWAKYPRQMLRARVVSEGVRTVYPMATSGMYVPEEVQEFDAPKPVLEAPANETGSMPMIEGEANPPVTKSRAKSRDTYAEFSLAISECQSVEDLAVLWSKPAAKEALATFPDNFKELIIAEKDVRKAALMPMEGDEAPPHEFVPPEFDTMAAAE